MIFKALIASVTLSLTLCAPQVRAVETLSSPLDLNTFFANVQSQILDSAELRQSVASTTVAPPTTTAPPTVTTTAPHATSSVSSVISGLLTAFGTALAPVLGPFAPFATIVGPLINSALTGLLTNGFTSLGGILKRDDLPNTNFETIMLNIPGQGSYILMVPKPEVVTARPETQFAVPKEPSAVNYNINNLFQMAAQQMQQQQKHQQQIQQQQQQQDLIAQFRKELMMMPQMLSV